MIELFPIMVLILGWHPDRPGEIDLQRPEILFETAAECESAAGKMVHQMNERAASQSGARYEFRCLPAPRAGEFEDLFRSLPERGE